MTEEASALSESSATGPTLVVEKTSIVEILGLLDVVGMELGGNPAPNNTRWVFDVRTANGEDIIVKLLDYRSGRTLKPELMSFYYAPMNDEAHDARVLLEEQGDGTLLISTEPTEKPALFRVGVDVMHSANR